MVFKKTQIALCLFTIGILFFSCKKDKFVGPELIGAGSDFDKKINFEIYQDNKKIDTEGDGELDQIVFSKFDTASFASSKFSSSVSWSIQVTGYTSGAVAKFSGLSDQINGENATWSLGRSSNEFFFQKNEFIKCDLKIIGLDTLYSIDSLKFRMPCDWNNKTYNGVRHTVVDAFDEDKPSTGEGLDASSPDRLDADVVLTVGDNNHVQGSGALLMAGTDLNNNGWISSKNHDRLIELAASSQLSNMPVDSNAVASELYFNLYVYGDSDYPGASIQLRVYEAEIDSFNSVDRLREYANQELSTLGDNVNVSDTWIYNLKIDWEGWKLVSVPYDKFKINNEPLGNGNKIKEPKKISAMMVSLLSDPTPGYELKTYIDFLTITDGGFPQFKQK
jgi:hypothetical protein